MVKTGQVIQNTDKTYTFTVLIGEREFTANRKIANMMSARVEMGKCVKTYNEMFEYAKRGRQVI